MSAYRRPLSPGGDIIWDILKLWTPRTKPDKSPFHWFLYRGQWLARERLFPSVLHVSMETKLSLWIIPVVNSSSWARINPCEIQTQFICATRWVYACFICNTVLINGTIWYIEIWCHGQFTKHGSVYIRVVYRVPYHTNPDLSNWTLLSWTFIFPCRVTHVQSVLSLTQHGILICLVLPFSS